MTEIMVGCCGEFADGDYRVVAVGELEIGIFRRRGVQRSVAGNCSGQRLESRKRCDPVLFAGAVARTAVVSGEHRIARDRLDVC